MFSRWPISVCDVEFGPTILVIIFISIDFNESVQRITFGNFPQSFIFDNDVFEYSCLFVHWFIDLHATSVTEVTLSTLHGWIKTAIE